VRTRFFLSHSSEDKPLVLRVDRALKALGLDVWTDKFEIRAGDSLVRKVFDEGLQKSDYVCAFITKFSETSRWVQEELEFAFVRSMAEGKPKILVLRFDDAKVPLFLRSRRYATVERHELGEIIREITFAAGMEHLAAVRSAKPYATLDYHDALQDGAVLYLLASRRDELDVEPFYDPEGVEFRLRHVFVLRVDQNSHEVREHYLSKARLAHTALRLIDRRLIIFFNEKMKNHDFAMDGRLYRLDRDTIAPKSVDTVFSDKNWGWSPWIDEHGSVHHGDSETPGNPYRIGTMAVPGKVWGDLAPVVSGWRADWCPFAELSGAGRETGYLRFLDIDPAAAGL
jgi:hypothetical protein